MAVTKITEKTVATSVKNAAHILVTQPENVDGATVESLRRATLNMLKNALGVSEMAGDVADLKGTSAKVVADVYSSAPSINMYSAHTEKMGAKTITVSTTTIDTTAAPSHYLIFPIVPDRGAITIDRTNKAILRACTTVEYPKHGTEISDYVATSDGYRVRITPSSGAKYLLVLYWLSTSDTATEEEALEGLRCYYGTAWSDGELATDAAFATLERRLQYGVEYTTVAGAASYAATIVEGHRYRFTAQGEAGGSGVEFYTTNSPTSTTRIDTIGGFGTIEKTVEFVASANATHIRKTSGTGTFVFTLTDLSTVEGRIGQAEDDIEELSGRLTRTTPSVRFNFDDYTIRRDPDAIASFDKETTTGGYLRFDHTVFMTQLYAAMDALVEAHPDYVSRLDAPEFAGMSYPSYADYEIRLYKLSQSGNTLTDNPAGYTRLHKILLTGGVHALEMESQYTLYQFAKRLCECTANDGDLLKLRNSFEIYILPILDGYGQKYAGTDPDNPNLGRTNYNGVNLNRNFPYPGWHVNGEGTSDYTGATAGSEFETQLVMNLIEAIAPDGVIDAHGHSVSPHVMYSMLTNGADGRARALYESASDITIAFKRAYPQYYGTSPALVNCGPAPNMTSITYGTVAAYAATAGVPIPACVEVPGQVAWNDGEYDGPWHEKCNDVVFGLDEYLLRNQVMHYCQWILDFVR